MSEQTTGELVPTGNPLLDSVLATEPEPAAVVTFVTSGVPADEFAELLPYTHPPFERVGTRDVRYVIRDMKPRKVEA